MHMVRATPTILEANTMSHFTKKYMTEDYERLYDRASLLELYLWNTQHGAEPDATEQYTSTKDGHLIADVRVQLWRATSASGGYVVITESLSNVWYLDEAIKLYNDNHSEHTLGIRICLERLAVKRNKMYEKSLGRPLMDDERVAL
jgi:hypothetical protein